MRFMAQSRHGIIFTDDYDEGEIKANKHLQNIASDFVGHYKNVSPFVVVVNDENGEIVSRFLVGRDKVSWL